MEVPVSFNDDLLDFKTVTITKAHNIDPPGQVPGFNCISQIGKAALISCIVNLLACNVVDLNHYVLRLVLKITFLFFIDQMERKGSIIRVRVYGKSATTALFLSNLLDTCQAIEYLIVRIDPDTVDLPVLMDVKCFLIGGLDRTACIP